MKDKKDNLGHTTPSPGSDSSKKPRKRKKNRTKAQWIERAQFFGILNPEKMTVKEMHQELKRLKDEGLIEDGRKQNGGTKTPTAETPAGKKAHDLYEEHSEGLVDVVTFNKETNKKENKRLTRIEALLEKLHASGMKGDVRAIVAYLDRVSGKPRQTLETGTIKKDEQKVPTPQEKKAVEAYIKAMES